MSTHKCVVIFLALILFRSNKGTADSYATDQELKLRLLPTDGLSNSDLRAEGVFGPKL